LIEFYQVEVADCGDFAISNLIPEEQKEHANIFFFYENDPT